MHQPHVQVNGEFRGLATLRRNPAAGPLRSAPQPQPHQVPALFQFGMVDERGPVVQNPAIVDEVHLTRQEGEFHAQLGPFEHVIEHVQRAPLVPR